ncbi:MAG: polyprenyl synthetase family protein [Syntrophobacterales bacterium]|nr:polyprenyl synthetase family protein [Syntrophobacterales bacterium]
MQMQDVFNYFGNDLKRAGEYMETCLESEVKLIPEIVHHLIGGGGKRFRPLLLLAAAELCGYRGERRYPLSAMIEFIHTATLFHDDVVDHAETRRGRISANRIWGNEASVLIGDFLYSKSFKLMTEDGNRAILKLISQTTNMMSEGEVFQLMKAGDVNTTEEEYLAIVEKKTAILISAACAIGGIIADAKEEQVAALTRFGMGLGTAFQITDDALDYVGKEEEFGKAIGQDIRDGKLTMPLIRTLKKCTQEEKTLVQNGVKNRDEDSAAAIMKLINRYDGIPYSLQKAKKYVAEAKGFLAKFADSDAKTALFTVADYVVGRRV